MKMSNELVEIQSCQRLVEGGVVYAKGDTVLRELVAYDRLVFLLAKGTVSPVGGLEGLEEPLFTDVMEIRD